MHPTHNKASKVTARPCNMLRQSFFLSRFTQHHLELKETLTERPQTNSGQHVGNILLWVTAQSR